MAGKDLYDQGRSNKSYAAQQKKAAGLIDPGFLTEPAKASQRTRKGDGPAYEASHGDEYAAGTQGAEPKRFAKGGPVKHDDEAEDTDLFNKLFNKREKAEGEPVKKAKGGSARKPIGPIKKGALHEDLGIPQSQAIGMARLKKAENSPNKKIAKRARFAVNMHKKDGGTVDAAEKTDRNDTETGARKGPRNPEQGYAKGGDVKGKSEKPKSKMVPRNKTAKMAPPMPPAMNAPPPDMGAPPPAMGGAPGAGPGPAPGGMPGFAQGGVAKIRHGEMTKSQKQTPNKPSGWNAYD